MLFIHKYDTVCWFFVKVPVLSVHKQLVEPKLYKMYKFLHIMFLAANFLTAKVNITVTYKLRTPGTLATVTPIAIIIAIMILNPVRWPPTNVKTPIPRENNVTKMINLSTSALINWGFYTSDSKRLNISQNKLLFPVFMTKPFPVP